jgi:hypothetical protein
MRTRIGFPAVAAVALATVLASGAVLAQGKVDVTGKWVLTVESQAGTTNPTLTLKQDGEKLTGHYSSATLGEADINGTVKGQSIAFSFAANVQGASLNVSYTGTIDGKDAMKGTASFGEAGDGTWTAKRQ